jgi:hypothetical protein
MTPRFNNPDLVQLDYLRELLRGNQGFPMPAGPHGLVFEDLDLVIRHFGARFGLNDVGMFRLSEIKHRDSPLGHSKIKTFGMIDSMLRTHPESDRYGGFYVIRYDREITEFTKDTIIEVNGVELKTPEFLEWCKNPISEIPRYWGRHNG